MCKRCFDVGPQTFGAARSFTREFHIWREKKKREKNNNHTDGPIQPVNDIKENNDIKEELQRLVEGYTKYIGKSKIKSFVTEAFSFVKIPEWQKSKHWMVRKNKPLNVIVTRHISRVWLGPVCMRTAYYPWSGSHGQLFHPC